VNVKVNVRMRQEERAAEAVLRQLSALEQCVLQVRFGIRLDGGWVAYRDEVLQMDPARRRAVEIRVFRKLRADAVGNHCRPQHGDMGIRREAPRRLAAREAVLIRPTEP
jgi:hypothetical protein